jgi:O-acetyl-ADP-ribose deacetylase (regulator of RNase III)
MKVLEGDLIKLAKEGQFDVIVHGCNCMNTMGKGIAAQVRKEFPEAFRADQDTEYADEKKLGSFTFAEYPDLIVVNAYTQYHYWSPGQKRSNLAEYAAISRVFLRIKDTWGGQGKRFGIPKIGAGLAGGDWEAIQPLIEEAMAGEDLTLVEYKPC